MTGEQLQQEPGAWAQAACAAALFAVAPFPLQGIVLRARPGPVRDQWLQQLRELLPQNSPWRRMPLQIADDRLLGGLDLCATLRSGRPIADPGLLAECHDGVLLLAMAERLEPGVAARLAAVLDSGEVPLERGGLSRRVPTHPGMIALDEGIGDDEFTPVILTDRLALHVNLEAIPVQDIGKPYSNRSGIAAARERLPAVKMGDDLVEALCRAALELGIESLRATVLAIRVAKAAAALADHELVSEADAALAAQLVFSSRATRVPEEGEPQEAEQEQDQSAQQSETPEQSREEQERTTDADEDRHLDPQSLNDRVLDATQAAIPPQLLQQLRYPDTGRQAARSSARSAARQRPAQRGRRVGTRPGDLSDRVRLNLVETLRVAAPWQAVRRAEAAGLDNDNVPAVRLRREDFRINRYQQRAATTTVFAVDASGSAALHRLAEAKGAVELLLAESYQRRDQVALVTFRGQRAELLLSPTRSLVRAKRNLAALPGGGGTPLAAGIRLALDTALAIRRKAETPVVILLTDGRANVTLDGQGDRSRAEIEALDAARALRLEGITALLLDTSPRPRPAGRQLADAMGASYLSLPHADAQKLTGAAHSLVAMQTREASPV